MGSPVDGEHPALELDETERTAYLSAVAWMASADNHVDDVELQRLRELCDTFALTPAGVESVLAAAHEKDHMAFGQIMARLKESDLRFALLTDAIYLAYADDVIVEAEAAELAELAEALDIGSGQALLVRRYVEARLGKTKADAGGAEVTAARLAGAGVPVAALALSATLGAPIVAGVSLAAALGVSSYVSVKWLYRKVTGRGRSVQIDAARAESERLGHDDPPPGDEPT